MGGGGSRRLANENWTRARMKRDSGRSGVSTSRVHEECPMRARRAFAFRPLYMTALFVSSEFPNVSLGHNGGIPADQYPVISLSSGSNIYFLFIFIFFSSALYFVFIAAGRGVAFVQSWER